MLFVIDQYSDGKYRILKRDLRVPALQQGMKDDEQGMKDDGVLPKMEADKFWAVGRAYPSSKTLWKDSDPEHSRRHNFSIKFTYRTEA